MASRIKYSLVFLVIALILFPGCRGSPTDKPLDLLVPQRADLILKVEIEQIISDADFAHLYQRFAAVNPGMPRTLKEALDRVTDETGIDPRDFREAVVFANTSEVAHFMESPPPGVPYWGALIRGSFAEKRMMLAIAGLVGREFENYKHNGAKIYYYTEEGETLFSFTFVSNDLIVVGSSRAVEDTIDVVAGDYESISGIVYDLYKSLPQAYLKVAFSVPPSITTEIPSTQEIEGLQLNIQPLRDVKMVGLTFDNIGSSVRVGLELHFHYKDSAQETAELFDNLIALTKTTEPELEHYLDMIEITARGSIFSLRVTETIDNIEDLMR